MAFASKSMAVVAFLALLPLGACATQTVGRAVGPQLQGPGYDVARELTTVAPARLTPPESHDGLLSSPPNDARPGECYAKVVVPGQPIGAPPAQPRAVWVQTPPGPGQVSPTWCIYYLPGAQPQPVAMTPERFGWIRVICDKDATEEKIRHVQRRLHEWGDYDGAYDGHFDSATAQGVVRFQEQRHIEHGGYLSVKTVEMLDGAPPQAAAPAFDPARPSPYVQALTQGSYGSPPPPPAPPMLASPIYQAQAYPQTAPQPAFASACPTACAPVAPPPAVYAPPPPPQPQVVVQRVIQPIYVPQPQPVYAPPPPPQVVVQRVVQPVYIPQPQPQMACAQPTCMTPAPNPCGMNSCGAPGGYPSGGYSGGGYWGGGYDPHAGIPPYYSANRSALLYWPGKTIY